MTTNKEPSNKKPGKPEQLVVVPRYLLEQARTLFMSNWHCNEEEEVSEKILRDNPELTMSQFANEDDLHEAIKAGNNALLEAHKT